MDGLHGDPQISTGNCLFCLRSCESEERERQVVEYAGRPHHI
jgi:hypothetical protein